MWSSLYHGSDTPALARLGRPAASFVPTPEMYAQALTHGFDPARLHYVGRPVRRQFASLADVPREQVIADLNRHRQWDLDPARLTIFAASGAEGATHIERAARLALDVSQDVQVILACGVNWPLYHRCQGIERLYAFPFTSQIAPHMAAAHLVMGRCSPNILFEALTLGKPFIATSSLPGQEEGNLRFIQQHGLGWVAFESTQLRTLIGELASDFSSEGSILNAMRATVQVYQRKNMLANASLVLHIRTLIDYRGQPEIASPASSTKAAV